MPGFLVLKPTKKWRTSLTVRLDRPLFYLTDLSINERSENFYEYVSNLSERSKLVGKVEGGVPSLKFDLPTPFLSSRFRGRRGVRDSRYGRDIDRRNGNPRTHWKWNFFVEFPNSFIWYSTLMNGPGKSVTLRILDTVGARQHVTEQNHSTLTSFLGFLSTFTYSL